MKLLFHMLLFPAIIAAIVSGLGCGLVYLNATALHSAGNGGTMFSNIYLGLVHLSLAVGLALAVLDFVFSCALTIFGFIAKTWFGAIAAGGIAAACFFMSAFLLNATI